MVIVTPQEELDVVTERDVVISDIDDDNENENDNDEAQDNFEDPDGDDLDGEVGEEEDDDEDDEFPISVFGAEEKKRLEQERERKRHSILLEKESLRESRVIFFRLKAMMSPEQLRRLRLVMGKLIAMSPPVADDRAKLSRAFVVWAEKLPLYLKCNELRKQFDERGIALEVLRDSYYRDVLSVKQHVERIYKDRDMPLELKELCGSVPSMDFRKLLERSHTNESSNQLRDGLMSTNLVSKSVKQKWGKNPWEQGHAYQVYKRVNPERLRTGGATLNLYAPCRHRLYIKYCRQCVGIMSLVNDWNKDVEMAINTKMADDTVKELREVVKNLNATIAEMKYTISAQTEKIDEFEKGNKWWGEWTKKQTISSDAELKIKQLRLNWRQWEETARMAFEEKATIQRDFDLYKITETEKYNKLQNTLETVTAANDEHDTELNDEIEALKLEIEERKVREDQQDDEIQELKRQNQKSKDEANRLKRLNAQLNKSLDEKDRQMAQYREETINRIENLNSQIAELNLDLENQEKEYDRISDLLEKEKQENQDKSQALKTLQDEVGKLHNVIREKDEKIEKLEVVEDDSSDDDSEGITEEILEDYKEALQYIPRAMRKEVARNMAAFGFDNDDDEEAIDDFPTDMTQCLPTITDGNEQDHIVKDLYDDDDFSFQHVDRRSSELHSSEVVENPSRINKLQPKTFSVPSIQDPINAKNDDAVADIQTNSTVAPTSNEVKSQSSSLQVQEPLFDAKSLRVMPQEVNKPALTNHPAMLRKAPRQASMTALEATIKRKERYHKHSSLDSTPVNKGSSFRKETLGQRPDALLEVSKLSALTDDQLEEMKEEGIRKANLKKNILKLVPMLAPFIKPPRLTLKVVATAVRFMVRFKLAIDRHDFRTLGMVGRKAEINRVKKEFAKLPVTIRNLENRIKLLEASECNFKNQIENLTATIAKLNERNKELTEKASLHADDVDALTRDIRRQHIIGQCQRNFAAELSETLGIIRNRIYMLIKYEGDIPVPLKEEDANKLEDQSIIKELTEEEEEEAELQLKYRVSQLFRKLRVHVMDVSQFVQENKRLRPISTFALGMFPDFYSFGSKFRNELRNLKLFKKRALTDLSIVEKRWVVKTLKVYTSEANYRDLYFSRLCPACLDGCERGPDGQWNFKKKKNTDKLESGRSAGVTSPKEIKALTDAVSAKVREELEKKHKEILDEMNKKELALQDTINSLQDQIYELKTSLAASENLANVLREEVTEAQTKYDVCKREVFVLRNAVQDSYRVIEENALQQACEREEKRRVKGTQIACSVCAIRYEKEEHGHAGLLTDHVDETDRVIFPRVSHHLQRVRGLESLEKKKARFEFAYAPFTGDNVEPSTTISKYRQKDRSSGNEMMTISKQPSVETAFGELMVGTPTPNQLEQKQSRNYNPPPATASKFSQMKNIPSNPTKSPFYRGTEEPAAKSDPPMSKIQVSKVASLLQGDSKIAKFKKLRDNNLLNLTSAETAHMIKLLGSASKNNLENKKSMKLSQRPISAPSHKR
mmetsp:Transcript_6292/g.10278  ORF Transcript_6292/g.10278 Transcript_6292/m.10278 type:complete len:1525 (+) Transcript_6292:40-4614(+)